MAGQAALMYAGHFAVGVAIRTAEPRVPMWAAVLGAGWLDIVHGVLVAAGVEHVEPDRTKFLGWALVDMPWTHSLAAAVAWSLVGAAAFARKGRAVAIAIAAAVFSHFALDLVVHEHDLALAPGSDVRMGLGLWGISPMGAWALEAAFVAACLAWYVARVRRDVPRWWGVVAVVAALQLSFLPQLSAMRMAGLHFAT